MNGHEKQLISDIKVGGDADKFLNQTELGRALREKALQDEQAALLALKDADPNDAKLIRQIQNDAHTPAMALQYILELINTGKNAQTVLEMQNAN